MCSDYMLSRGRSGIDRYDMCSDYMLSRGRSGIDRYGHIRFCPDKYTILKVWFVVLRSCIVL